MRSDLSASRLLARPAFWVAFGTLVVVGLYVYGRALSRDQTDLEKARTFLAAMEQERDSTAAALSECKRTLERGNTQITALTKEVERLQQRIKVLEVLRVEPAPTQERSHPPPRRDYGAGEPPTPVDVGDKPISADQHSHGSSQSREDRGGEAESLVQVQVLIVWEPDEGLDARRIQRLLRSRGASVSFETAHDAGRRQSAIYAPPALRERAERIARVAGEVRALPVRSGGTRDGYVEVYLGKARDR